MKTPIIRKSPVRYATTQMDMFRQFVTNDPQSVSNSFKGWDEMPIFILDPQHQEKLRLESGHADPYEWSFNREGKCYSITIQPALIKQADGSYKAYFPSTSEEFINICLRKILCGQRFGNHDGAKQETWVRFSLSMLLRELKKFGRSRNITEIKQSIEIMNKCNVSFSVNGKEVWSGALLQDLVSRERSDYLNDPDSLHAAKLPLPITLAIEDLNFRQHNYQRLMICQQSLTRWLYTKLVHYYTNAGRTQGYHFSFATIQNESGLLQQSTDKHNRAKVKKALDELVTQEVISKYTANESKLGRTITDVIYDITPTEKFISEQKAANMRQTEIRSQSGLVKNK